MQRFFKKKLEGLKPHQKIGPLAKELKTRVGFVRLPNQNNFNLFMRKHYLKEINVTEEQIKSKDAYIARIHFPMDCYEFNVKRGGYRLAKKGENLPTRTFAQLKEEMKNIDDAKFEVASHIQPLVTKDYENMVAKVTVLKTENTTLTKKLKTLQSEFNKTKANLVKMTRKYEKSSKDLKAAKDRLKAKSEEVKSLNKLKKKSNQSSGTKRKTPIKGKTKANKRATKAKENDNLKLLNEEAV